MRRVAVLIACHNRKVKSLACLDALCNCVTPPDLTFDIFLVDDGSTDGTEHAVREKFPQVRILHANGNLFWAGSMRFAWNEALKENYDGYLLLNDDTYLFPSALISLLSAHEHSLINYGKGGIYVGATNDPDTNEHTYGGSSIVNGITGKSSFVGTKNGTVQPCDFANGNILLVSKNVVETIGILSDKFTHLLADFDYTLTASKQRIPVLVCPKYCGSCINDHGKNWMSAGYSLSERIKYLKSPKYLAYNEYLFFIRRHFPFYLPVAFLKLWAKTLFPGIWDKFKN